MTLTHIALERDWREAAERGHYRMSTLGRTIADEGYMHCSGSDDQLAGVAARFYGEVTEPLVLLTIDEGALAEHELEVRWEPPTPGVDELFPHVYGGDLPVAVVSAVEPYEVLRG